MTINRLLEIEAQAARVNWGMARECRELSAALREARADAHHLLQYAPEAVRETYLELRPWLAKFGEEEG